MGDAGTVESHAGWRLDSDEELAASIIVASVLAMGGQALTSEQALLVCKYCLDCIDDTTRAVKQADDAIAQAKQLADMLEHALIRKGGE